MKEPVKALHDTGLSQTPASGPVTLAAVAAHAGVSLATASRVVNGSVRKVRPELEERVRASSVQLGYVVDARAQAMALGADQTIALIVGDIADPYFAGIAAGLIAAASERSLIVTLIATGNDPDSEAQAVNTLRSQRPRAIVLASSRRDDAARERTLERELVAYEGRGGRVALIGSVPEGEASGHPRRRRTVGVNNRVGAHELAQSLLGLGYQNFAILTGPEDARTPRERVNGFVDGLSAHANGSARYLPSPLNRDAAHRITSQLLHEPVPVRFCIFAVTDAMALGALTAIREAGLTPGRDIGVAGFDDIALLRDVTPSLTTVAISLHEIGRRALTAAIDDAFDDAPPVAASVQIRASTPIQNP